MDARDPADELDADLFIDRRPPRLSKHVELEIANAAYRDHKPGDPPPLASGEPVPGCDCPSCTKVSEDDPVRAFGKRKLREREGLPVEEAKRRSILEVASWLGLGEPVPRGSEWAVLCFLHNDTNPSLYLNEHDGVWFCHPCQEGGDTIRLLEQVRGCSFVDAVKELAGV